MQQAPYKVVAAIQQIGAIKLSENQIRPNQISQTTGLIFTSRNLTELTRRQTRPKPNAFLDRVEVHGKLVVEFALYRG